MNVSTFTELAINPGDDEESNSGGQNHLEHQTQQLGSTLDEVANVPGGKNTCRNSSESHVVKILNTTMTAKPPHDVLKVFS